MFAATQDQELLESATGRFLEDNYPVERVRQLAGEPAPFEPKLWRAGAELGWTAMLVPEEAGGGSVSGNGVADLLVVCSLFGRHAAPGPLFGTNIVAAALGRWGTAEQRAGPLAELIAGDAVAAWGHASTGQAPGGRRSPVTAAPSSDWDGGGVVLSGRVPRVEGAAGARYLLLSADGPDGLDRLDGRSQHLVPLDLPGVELSPLRGLDLTRRYHDVVLRDVSLPAGSLVGEPGTADEHDAELADLLATMLVGEMVGATDRAFAMTLRWTADRYSFGRPLGSYQAIKHRMADARAQLEASEAVAGRAAEAVGAGAADARSWASAGMAFVAQRAPEVVQECVQFHGGIGVTYELDLHLFLRRVVVDSQLYGSSRDFARRLGALVVAEGAMPS
jgi:alkylation response protein AidB-like acyl-CoA dehydrogenase